MTKQATQRSRAPSLDGEQWVAIIHLFRGEAREAGPILDHAIRVASDAGIPRGMWANFLSGWAQV